MSTRYRTSGNRPSVNGQSTQRSIWIPLIIACIVIACAGALFAFLSCSSEDGAQGSAGTVETTARTDEPIAASGEDESQIPANFAVPHAQDDRVIVSPSLNDAKPAEPVVYLTFDDGPSGQTQKILDTLDKYGIKATWFIMTSSGSLDMVEEIWNRGHQVAVHTNTHDLKGIYSSAAAFFDDMETAVAKIEAITGVSPTLFRFPGGSHNDFNAAVLPSIQDGMRSRNWHYFDWNVSIGDSTIPMSDVDTLLENFLGQSEGKHSINMLMHDSDAKSTTAEALDQVISNLIERGFKFDYITAESFGYHF